MSWLLGELPFWRSPLHSLGSLSPHPLAEIDATQTSAVCWGDVFKRWEETLDKFRPISETNQEKTVGLLRVFYKHLPEDGKLVLMKDVITIGPDDDKLRELAQHLRNAVLKPSESGWTRSTVWSIFRLTHQDYSETHQWQATQNTTYQTLET